MALESEEKIKVLDEYIGILKQNLLFSMAERKRKPENTMTHDIITIKQELDKAVQEKWGKVRFIIAISTIASTHCC
jgi:hypothetical protein